MKRALAPLLVSILAIGLVVSPKVSAHVLKQDDGVSAVLHIDPDDNPQAGVKTLLDLDFSSDTGNFSLGDYRPTVTVKQAGKTLSTTSATAAYFGSGSQAVATVIFPKVGIYDVIVAGGGSAGTPTFSLDYTERVATGQASASSGAGLQVGLVSAATLVILGIIAYTVIPQGHRYAVPVNKVRKKEKNHA